MMETRGGDWNSRNLNFYGCRRADAEVSPFDFSSFDVLRMPEPPETPRVSEMDGEM